MASYRIQLRSLQDAIQHSVKRYIVYHGFRPGDALPAEGELAEHLGISRPSLREAMKVLQTLGVVEIRHGAGTYVGSLSLDPLAEGVAFHIRLAAGQGVAVPPDLLDLIELRQALEMRLMCRAVGTHCPAQLDDLYGLVAEMRDLDPTSDTYGKRDLALHLAFYAPLGSRIGDEFLRACWAISNRSIWVYPPASAAVMAIQHERIVTAVAAGDTEAAVCAIEAHLEHLATAMRTGYQPDRR